MTILNKLIEVQTTLKAPKNQVNAFGKYKYRSCEDILEAVKPHLAQHQLGLMITDTIKETATGYMYVEARAILTNGPEEVFEVTAQAGIDTNKKGMDDSQAFGSASSYARKYALNGLFLIDDTKDADATNNHDKSTPKAKASLEPNTPAFNKAKDFVANGGDISRIKNKYNISAETEKLLYS
jgi:hypothetical protein